MNPETNVRASALGAIYRRLGKKFSDLNFHAYVPAVYLDHIAHKNNKDGRIIVGAQNIYIHDKGSYTGAISIPMVQSLGVNQVLIGHSERRSLFGVNNEVVGQKIEQAIIHNMPMTVCFGENSRDRTGTYAETLEKQLNAILEPFGNGRKTGLLTLAYEPVWAIGAGAKRPVTEDELFSTIILIRNIIAKKLGQNKSKQIPILYGGSVNGDNAHELSRVPGVGGFLVGRASLNRESLESICQQVTK